MSLTKNFNGIRRVVLGFIIAGFLFAGIGANAQNEQNLLEIVETNEDTSTFVAAVNAAELADVLISEGPNTLFVPTNEAFDNLPSGVLDALLLPENKETLVSILTYHIVAQDLNSTQVLEGVSFATVNEAEINVEQKDDSVFINENSKLVSVDFDGNNGYVHLIDTVLVPESVDVAAFVTESSVANSEMTPRTGGADSIVMFGGLASVLLIGSLFGLTGKRFSKVTN